MGCLQVASSAAVRVGSSCCGFAVACSPKDCSRHCKALCTGFLIRVLLDVYGFDYTYWSTSVLHHDVV